MTKSGNREHASPPASPPNRYRKGVGIVLANRDGLIFVARRIDTPGDHWQMPQGGIDKNEKPKHAAVRELQEETGVVSARPIAATDGWITYDLPPEIVGKVWRGRYRGQKQKWFAMRFEGADSEIELDGEHAEFDAWRWVEMERLVDLIIPFKKQLYREVVAQLGPKIRADAAGGSAADAG